MKTRITLRDGRNINSNKILEIGYCELYYLLKFETPQYYSAGVYGWNCDWYVLSRCTICTGYRPVRGIRPDYDMIEKFDSLARESNDRMEVKGLLYRFQCEVLESIK